MPKHRDTGNPFRMPPGVPHPIDIHVGSRVRSRRKALGMSQGELGDALGLTFQQVQKYERGANRIGASRLYQLSRILDVPVMHFFDDMAPDLLLTRADLAPGMEPAADPRDDAGVMESRETTDLVEAYYAIEDGVKRRAVHDLVATLSKAAQRTVRQEGRRHG